jgi:nucleoside-diphosphate-sugar epimerase
MRVLVTGHKGYIGTVMTPLLLEAGHDVVGYDSDLYRRCTYPAGGPIVEVPMIEKDTRVIEARDLDGFDAVIHLAALSNDPLGNLNPRITYEINHEAVVRTAALAKKAGVKRFLFASSCSNYGSVWGRQGQGRDRAGRIGRQDVCADLPAARHCLWRVAAHALRHRA